MTQHPLEKPGWTRNDIQEENHGENWAVGLPSSQGNIICSVCSELPLIYLSITLLTSFQNSDTCMSAQDSDLVVSKETGFWQTTLPATLSTSERTGHF